MTLEASALPTENLENITDAQMETFAVNFNAIEPGGYEPVYNGLATNDGLLQMIDFMDAISILGLTTAVVYLTLPYLRKLPSALSMIRS